MGTLEDILFDSSTYQPKLIVLGSSFFEEFMEEIGELDNIDEIVPMEYIDHIEDDYIILSKELEELATTNPDGTVPAKGFRYSSLKMFDIKDPQGEIEGELFDILLNGEDTEYLIYIEEVKKQLSGKQYQQKFIVKFKCDQLQISEETITIPFTVSEIVNKISDTYNPESRGMEITRV